ncbi:MAG: phosphodiester glycosidase family protein [Alphaproteobacteria bacterium]|nr:phosphodiester glycosidase family protein [Alphaproteobacteria bacterium]MBL6940243.1 phosphodiester glycosidase family protein [Alphaproteobacteria bacterium]MBL7096849.1 phosphodiester glycosidase family protein [Alphaproteobacteria bacterium]
MRFWPTATMRRMAGVLAAALSTLFFGAAAPGANPDPACTEQTFEAVRFLVCPFDPARHELRLMARDANGHWLRSFARLAKTLGPDGGRLSFAMNAGMYEEDGTPVGLYIENGTELRPLNMRDAEGNFYMKPNGVFSLRSDGTARIEETLHFAIRSDRPLYATQSGPLLVMDGKLHPAITADGPSRNIRNGVGLRNGTALFVMSEDPVSFGKLARFFRDALKCDNALYLDGTVSSLWVPAQRIRLRGADIGPMIVVLDKP